MIMINNKTSYKWSLYFVFAFSIVSFLVALQGASAPVRIIKPLMSISWLITISILTLKYQSKSSISTVCCLLVFYALISTIISSSFTYDKVSSILTGDFYLLPYLGILYACFTYDENIIVFLKRLMVFSIIIFVAVIVLFRNSLFQESALYAIADMAEQGFSLDTVTKSFCYSSGLLLLLLPVLNIRLKSVVMIAYTISLLASIFIARRNLVVTNILYILFAIVIYIRNNRNNSKLVKCFIYIVIAYLLYNGTSTIISILNGTNDSVFLSYLTSRVNSDSRSHVLIPFYKYMNESVIYWIFGHGIDAKYYSDLGWRGVIETGYLQIIMKIGVIGFLSYIIIFIKTILKSYKGNVLMQASSSLILIYMMEMLYAGVPTFGLAWMNLWICVGICNSKRLKTLSNKQIQHLLCQ